MTQQSLAQSFYLLESRKKLDKSLELISSKFAIHTPQSQTPYKTRLILYPNEKEDRQKFERFMKKFKDIELTNQDPIDDKKNNDAVFIAFSDHDVMRELSEFLLNLGVLPWIVGKNTFGNESVLKELQIASKRSKCAFIIMTPDDKCKCKSKMKKRPRQNVVFEYGLFLAKLPENCITILHKGDYDKMEIPSDVAGIKFPIFKKSILERKPSILNTLHAAKIKMTPKNLTSKRKSSTKKHIPRKR